MRDLQNDKAKEANTMFGLKTIAGYLNISIAKVKDLFGKGMPHIRDESGMFITTKSQIDKWFENEIEHGKRKKQ